MAVMGKVVLLKPQTLPERSESVLQHKAYCTEEKCDIAASQEEYHYVTILDINFFVVFIISSSFRFNFIVVVK